MMRNDSIMHTAKAFDRERKRCVDDNAIIQPTIAQYHQLKLNAYESRWEDGVCDASSEDGEDDLDPFSFTVISRRLIRSKLDLTRARNSFTSPISFRLDVSLDEIRRWYF